MIPTGMRVIPVIPTPRLMWMIDCHRRDTLFNFHQFCCMMFFLPRACRGVKVYIYPRVWICVIQSSFFFFSLFFLCIWDRVILYASYFNYAFREFELLHFYSSAPTAGLQPCHWRSDSDSAGASTIEHENLCSCPVRVG